MPTPPLRKTHTLSDAFELIGRRLFGDTWTGYEYLQGNVMSPEELAALRAPLEAQLNEASADLDEINRAIHRTLDAKEIDNLKEKVREAQSRWSKANFRLNWDDLPAVNDYARTAFESYERRKKSEDVLLEAIRLRRFVVHDGHGRELNSFVWTDQRFRYYIDLSIVVNGKMSGEPRRQAARIDQDPFDPWLATVRPLVEPATAPSIEEQLRDFLKREVRAAQSAPRKTKSKYLAAAKSEIEGLTKRTFEFAWAREVPADWRKPGAPKGSKSSRGQR